MIAAQANARRHHERANKARMDLVQSQIERRARSSSPPKELTFEDCLDPDKVKESGFEDMKRYELLLKYCKEHMVIVDSEMQYVTELGPKETPYFYINSNEEPLLFVDLKKIVNNKSNLRHYFTKDNTFIGKILFAEYNYKTFMQALHDLYEDCPEEKCKGLMKSLSSCQEVEFEDFKSPPNVTKRCVTKASIKALKQAVQLSLLKYIALDPTYEDSIKPIRFTKNIGKIKIYEVFDNFDRTILY